MAPFPATILLATDGSPDARQASRAAADLANRGNAALHLVHAWDNYYGMGGMMPLAYPLLQEDGARELLEGEVAFVRSLGATVAGAHLVQGSAPESVLEAARAVGAGLIVIGSRGHGGVHRLVMGSVAEGVVHHACVPVLVMRGSDAAWPPRRIVVGDDSSPDALSTLRLAAEIAGLFASGVVLVRAMHGIEDTLRDGRALEDRVVDDVLEFAQGELQDHAAGLSPDVAGRCAVHISVEEPAVALLDAASADDGEALVAVGSRGLGALQRLRFGSVSTKVLRAAHGPVLVGPRARAAVVPMPQMGRHTAAR